MGDQTISTNLLLDALIKNMESFDSDHKSADNFTLSQFLKLVAIIDSFIAGATVEPDEEDKEALVKNFYLQTDVILCRQCNEALNSRQDAHSHWQTHETKTTSSSEIETPGPGDPPINPPLPLETPAAVGSKYLDRNCIPKNMEYLSKKVKTFLSKDADEVARKLHLESYYIQQDQRNAMVVMDLTSSLIPNFPLTKCYLFGSRFFGTATFESDIDIFANLQNNYCGRKGSFGKLDPRKSVQLCAVILERNPLWQILCVTATARIPVLQVVHKSFNLKCDISFTSGLAHCNSSLLNYLFELQPTCRALVCYIKSWNSDSSLTGYAIALMAVFFFQCHNLLPSVHHLQNDSRTARYIDVTRTQTSRWRLTLSVHFWGVMA
ncbi:terminal uridylyltransferase Tailor-like isoform X2 [Anopheles bellator]|uniref:terminal uridylyltransferase Tailor-like isoform X2 n=1 Tax=Anopheles bellator TaxID=139047 RepID=UPI0026475A27|nr:terminal uridylyltransferase Tailor-like isoform X2 [Anopheles bellator]